MVQNLTVPFVYNQTALSMQQCAATVSNVTILNAECGAACLGQIQAIDSSYTISSCYGKNLTSYQGGFIYVSISEGSSVPGAQVIQGTVIEQCFSQGYGGGIYLSQSAAQLLDLVVTGC